MPEASLAHRDLLRQVARRLSVHADLQPEDLAAIEGLQGEVSTYRRDADITNMADAPLVVAHGWACEMRLLAKGGRQIFRFILPGDFIGSFWPRSDKGGCTVVALTRLELHAAGALMARDPCGRRIHGRIVQAARCAEDEAAVLLLDHMVRLGARDAYAGLSHLLLELHQRCTRAGLTEETAFPLPIGQRTLAQAMGLTPAHINHTLQRMTADGLIEARGQAMHLLQVERMASIADYRFAGSEIDLS